MVKKATYGPWKNVGAKPTVSLTPTLLRKYIQYLKSAKAIENAIGRNKEPWQ